MIYLIVAISCFIGGAVFHKLYAQRLARKIADETVSLSKRI